MAPGPPICAICGQPAWVRRTSGPARSGPTDAKAWCSNAWCSQPARPLRAVFAVAGYGGALRRAVVAYKYGQDLRWARPFAALLHGFLVSHETWFEEVDVLCPVPAYTGTGAKRGWGHVELMCQELAAVAAPVWPVESLLAKAGPTAPLCNQTRSQRRRLAMAELATAFRASSAEKVAGRRVVLIDDVCASGSTLLAAAGALRQAGAEEVMGLVLAQARWRGRPGDSPGSGDGPGFGATPHRSRPGARS